VSDPRVLVIFGIGPVPADQPILRADDLGPLRGDGIFETMHIRHGQAWLLDDHLTRLSRSATRMEIVIPPLTALADLVKQAVGQWPAGQEGALRLVCTRGPESGGSPTIYAAIAPVAETTRAARHAGIAVLTATLGQPAALRPTAPWLLPGAKTLSYAINMASQRWAWAAGADDVLWTSLDGYALEGPTSTLIWREDDTLFGVPVERTGILRGTTGQYLLDHAAELGWSADSKMIKPSELLTCAGAWYASSVRGLAAVRSLDGEPAPYSAEDTTAIRHLLGFD
jgi:4-amino-4-deoxychorismate lyase